MPAASAASAAESKWERPSSPAHLGRPGCQWARLPAVRQPAAAPHAATQPAARAAARRAAPPPTRPVLPKRPPDRMPASAHPSEARSKRESSVFSRTTPTAADVMYDADAAYVV
eukprot:jgi/Chrpa1/21124/Chrysochromulina_OHIO_Genome00008504-RA